MPSLFSPDEQERLAVALFDAEYPVGPRFYEHDTEDHREVMRSRVAALRAAVPEPESVKRLRESWARALLARDDVQGRAMLERMVEWYEQHDGKADDFGELWIVKDARAALQEGRDG